jgi:hypothetical protein
MDCSIARSAGTNSVCAREAISVMPDYFDELDEIIAAASLCPVCDALVLAYHSRHLNGHDSDPWEFMCRLCGTDFIVPESELAFQSMPMEWLSAKVCAA